MSVDEQAMRTRIRFESADFLKWFFRCGRCVELRGNRWSTWTYWE